MSCKVVVWILLASCFHAGAVTHCIPTGVATLVKLGYCSTSIDIGLYTTVLVTPRHFLFCSCVRRIEPKYMQKFRSVPASTVAAFSEIQNVDLVAVFSTS